MSSSDRRGSMRVDRPVSTRLSMELQYDDDDLEAMGISDGFRPQAQGVETSHNIALPQHFESRIPPLRPSSILKPKGSDSFALRHDGGMGSDLRANLVMASSANVAPTRSSSVSIDVALPRPESPYRGPAGPSHPYQMYLQDSRLARTASIATTSTASVRERSYAGPSGPAHPYGMYPQNIVAEAESSETPPPAPTPVPVGFPGSNSNYQRQLGPEGEEIAGIIGPDGHTEELPPYTQYPDEALARKTRPVVVVPVPGSPFSTISGAGGIGLATRNPEFASQEDLNSPQSRRSIMSDLSSHHVSTAAPGASEKPELKKWQQVARRKVCGIVPIWVFVLVALMFVIFGIILGTVLALFRPKHPFQSKNSYHPTPQVQTVTAITMTTTFDATPLTIYPTGLPTLPTGTFAIPITTPSISTSNCLVNTEQSNAWACNIGMGTGPLEISITSWAGSSPLSNNEVTMSYGSQSMTSFQYGAQAPQVKQLQVLKLVNDSDEISRGAAWWFQMPYNKVVVLHNSDLALVTKRQSYSAPPVSGFLRQGVAQTGDSPWFCYWNGTILEAFIYVNQTSSGASMASSDPATTASATASSSVPTNSNSIPPSYPPILQNYEKVVKIEEHRMSRGPQVVPPYCVQHSINADGSATPILNSTHQPITILLGETQTTSFSKRAILDLEERDRTLIARGSGAGCGCAWVYS